jgi:putative tryptophan/tyrosine transport system substrate-binding protein
MIACRAERTWRGDRMRRRDFITVLAGATAWMSAVCAEEPRHVIGFLSAFESSNEIPGAGGLASFYQGLKETRFIEGKNINVESRWADGHYDRLPSLAAELVARKVSVIVADGVPSAFAAKAATKTIPIVFTSGADPVKLRLVESLSRPNNNLTGVSIFSSNDLGPKDVELLHELLPAVSAIALLGNPTNANFQSAVPDVRAAADALRQHLEVLTASTEIELEAVFATMVQKRVGALIVMADPFLIARRRQLVELAARHAMPAIYAGRVFADVGGLMSYGATSLVSDSKLKLSRKVAAFCTISLAVFA